MTDTWLPFCIREPGPANKRGYGGVLTRTLADIEGEVKHSMEGRYAGALGRLRTPLTGDPYTQASWPLSIVKVGPPRQHFALEDVCWHAGLPGDRRTDTSLVGNLTLVGIEHEDYPDNKLNANQLHWTIEISRALRRLCPRIAARPPALGVNLWEHRMLSPTSCPSGLIPWPTIIAALKEEDMLDPKKDAVAFETMFRAMMGKFVGDPVKATDAEPIGHLGRYLRGGYPRLQRNVLSAVVKAGLLEDVARMIAKAIADSEASTPTATEAVIAAVIADLKRRLNE